MQPHQTTVDLAEIAKFQAMAAEWWDPNGKFKPFTHAEPVPPRLYNKPNLC